MKNRSPTRPRQLSTTFCPWVQGSHQQNPLSKSSSRESPNLRGSGPSTVWKLSLWEHRERDGWHGISGGWEQKNTFVSENQQNQDAVRKNKGISVKSQHLNSPSFQHSPISPPELTFSVPVFLCYTGGIWVWRTCLFLLFGNWIGGFPLQSSQIFPSGAFSQQRIYYQVPTIQMAWCGPDYGQEKREPRWLTLSK